MTPKNISGKYGELYAAKYLSENGYIILSTNYKTRFSEIDIIAQDKESKAICFIEVKTRKSKDFGYGTDFIFESKIKKIKLGAKSYVLSKKITSDIRFDVIEVYGNVLTSDFVVTELNHIKNAF